jgi:hypothetical protein
MVMPLAVDDSCCREASRLAVKGDVRMLQGRIVGIREQYAFAAHGVIRGEFLSQLWICHLSAQVTFSNPAENFRQKAAGSEGRIGSFSAEVERPPIDAADKRDAEPAA